MKIKLTTNTPRNYVNTPKSLEDWNSKDFLIYFTKQYGNLTGRTFRIPPQGWGGLMSRIKGFKEKLNLDNNTYKTFIDNVFTTFFKQEEYIPTFGAIVSEKVFYVVNNLKISITTTNDEFLQLRDQLYSSDLFQKLT